MAITQPDTTLSGPIEVAIHDIGHDGEGVGRYNDLTVFVNGAIPGDVALVQPRVRHPRYLHADLVKIVQPSAQRVEPRCPVFAQCGGCQLQQLDYQAQLAWKEERVRQVLARVGRLSAPHVLPVIGANHPWDYRNKAQFPVGRVDGRVVLGFYEQSSHRIVPVSDCLVQHPRIRQAAALITELLNDLGIPPYNEATGAGVLRHVLCRVGFADEQLLITLVVTRSHFAGLSELAARISAALPNLAGISLNINPTRGNRILGPHNQVITGDGYLHEVLHVNGLQAQFAISAPSFFQVNPVQAEELYGVALQYADIKADSTVLDAYCGTGSISLFLAMAGAKQVWGIEQTPEAVDDAKLNARINGVDNIAFFAGKVEDIAAELVQEHGRPSVLVVDPPRAGMAGGFIDTAVRWEPRRIVYVSCNPATLARDIDLLAQRQYRLEQVQPVDMFPHTAHIECVALMSRVEE